MGCDGIVPFAMEIIFDEVDRLELFVADLNPFGIAVVVHLTLDLKAGFGGRRGR